MNILLSSFICYFCLCFKTLCINRTYFNQNSKYLVVLLMFWVSTYFILVFRIILHKSFELCGKMALVTFGDVNLLQTLRYGITIGCLKF